MRYYMNDNSIYLPYWNPTNELSTYYALNDITFFGGNGNNMTDPAWILPDDAALSCSKFTVNPDLTKRFLNPGSTTASPFANYTCLARQIGIITADVPAKDAWQELIDEGLDYDIWPHDNFIAFQINGTNQMFSKSFRGRLEGVNTNVTCNEEA
eukprot:820924_1